MKTLERDSAYGAAMLTLRTALGLTRAELATHLCISRQAVGEWEAGSSYPKAQHFKALIALGVKRQAFAKGSAAEEIRVLWQVTHQKVLLDEHWLSTLLEHSHSPYPHLVPKPGDGQEPCTVPTARPTPLSWAPAATPRAPAAPPRVDWGDAQALSPFYGREQELAQISQWVVQEGCRVVSVLGIGGIGKSALSVSVMHRLVPHFEVVIFRSLRDSPSCEALLDDCLQVLSPLPLRAVPASLGPRIGELVDHLRRTRVLLVLDNLECLLSAGDSRGHFSPGLLGYRQLLRRVAETGHQSCLLLTSREQPVDLRLLEGRYSQVHSLHLAGLDIAACQQLLEEKELIGTDAEQESLIEAYAGNPLALRIVTETIVDLFGGEIGLFLAAGTTIVGSINDLLDEQFARISVMEQSVLYWLAISREPITLDELLALLVSPLPHGQLLEAVDSLHRRSLVERGKRVGSFTLQSVVLEYVTAVLIAEASQEILQRRLNRLIGHSLCLATAREYVRQTQERLLVSPLLANLQNAIGWRQAPLLRRTDGAGHSPGPVPTASVEELLLSLLDQLRKRSDSAQGYGPANLIALLRMQRGHLCGLDLSLLSLRGAYLQGIEMRDAKLTGAQISDIAFTEAVSAPRAVAISLDGTLWAAGGMQGEVRVWNGGGQILQRIWQAHTDLVYALAFSPDGRTLASGSRDGTIKLWDVSSQTGTSHSSHDDLIWTSWQNIPVGLAFSPDGSLLASAGLDTTVGIWDSQSGMNLQVLAHPSQVYAVTWSPDGHLLASGGVDGVIRLWERQKTLPLACVEVQSMQSNWVMSLAFAPDGRTLVSSHWDQMVKLWEVSSLRPLRTLAGQVNRGNAVVWSPNGRILAGFNKDKTIWLWDVEQGNYRAVLHEHTADVNGIAFAPDSRYLLSCSDDSTLRVWDVESCQCVRVIAGYAVSLYDIDWSPDGMQLVSGGSDGLVTIWDVRGETPPRVVHGHSWIASGVEWSPNGRFLASCGWDGVLRLWDPVLKSCIQISQDTSTLLLSMAWNPDGSLLACGTYLRGVQVWDMTTRSLRWVGQPDLAAFYSVAWSPDGTQLAGSDGDGNVYLWEGTDGTLLKRLSEHQGRVMSVVWSPDGRFLASGSGNRGSGELFVWDVQACRGCRDGAGQEQALSTARHQLGAVPHPMSLPMRTFVGHPGMVSAVAWCRSQTGASYGDCLVSGGSDGTLRWWDVQSGECVSVRVAHQGLIRPLRVSPDERWLASCGDDGTIKIWDLESATHLRTLQRDRPYERLNITGIRGLNEAQKATLQALGAIEEAAP